MKALQIVIIKFFNQTNVRNVTVFGILKKLIIKTYFSVKLYKIKYKKHYYT